MSQIQLHNTSPCDELAWPQKASNLNKNSSTLDFFNDFNVFKPLIVSPTEPVVEAVKHMQKSHENFAIVLDNKDHFLGIIDNDTINGPLFIKMLSEGYKRDELTVNDIMYDRDHLKAIDYSQIENSAIIDVLTALKENGEHHCIVLDENKHKIRGVLLGDNIAYKLKLSIDNDTRPSFISIFQAIN